ncbi:MAG: transglutaminase family protein [Hahellaceae bacterium]|nr:transglutaminase family protein [Hahellaceae bacterium]
MIVSCCHTFSGKTSTRFWVPAAEGFPFKDHWFDAFLEFRCPRIGRYQVWKAWQVELHYAFEPRHVLGEESRDCGNGALCRFERGAPAGESQEAWHRSVIIRPVMGGRPCSANR